MKDRKLTAAEMGRISPEEYRSRNVSGTVIVLDNVRSAYNVGSAFRSADAFGVSAVYLCGICAVPPSAEIHKTALGAEEAVPWRHFADTLEAVAALKAEGYTVVAVEQTENSVKLAAGGVPPEACATLGTITEAKPSEASLANASEVRTRKGSERLTGGTVSAANGGAERSEAAKGGITPGSAKLAFIFGNEVEGVQQAVVDASDFCLEIPQHGTKHSLNVAVTVGIVLFATSPAR